MLVRWLVLSALILATSCEVYDYEDTFEIERSVSVRYHNSYYHPGDNGDDDNGDDGIDDDQQEIIALILQSDNFDVSCSMEVGLTTQCKDAIKGTHLMDYVLRNTMDIAVEDIMLYNASLQILCRECLDRFNDYYGCIGEGQRIDPLTHAICTLERDSTQYCPTVFLEAMYVYDIGANYSCNASNDVDSGCYGDCGEYLADIYDQLNCCAGALFGTTSNVFLSFILFLCGHDSSCSL